MERKKTFSVSNIVNEIDYDPMNEQMKQSKKERKACLFYPNNCFKDNWDTLITLILLFTCVVTPAHIAFSFDQTEEEFKWKMINRIVDGLFAVDIIFSFCSVYVCDEFIVHDDRKDIACNYLRGWFTIDFFAIFEFDLIIKSSSEDGGANVNSMIRIMRVGRMYKLVKLTRLLRVLKVVKKKGSLVKYL